MPLRRRVFVEFAALLVVTLACAASSLRAQAPRPVGFLAENYDISATLDSTHQAISAVAKIDFRATDVSANVRVELHPNLIVSDVKGSDGKSLGFGRDSMNPLYVLITLPTPVAAGGHVVLTFTYSGLLANEENSPVPGVRAAVIGHNDAYLLLPARWFPLTNYPSNRYTATFRLNVPDNFAVAGSGKSSAPTPMVGKPGRRGRAATLCIRVQDARPARQLRRRKSPTESEAGGRYRRSGLRSALRFGQCAGICR